MPLHPRRFEVRRSIGRAGTLLLVAGLAATASGCGDGGPTQPSAATPVVSAVSPASGPVAGGTSLRITGGNFAAGATVLLGGTPATNVLVESATVITAQTPTHAAGPVDVVVTIQGRSGSLPSAFTYIGGAAPTITSIAVRGTKWANEPANFADLGENVTVTAAVADPDTPVSALTYTWSVTAGTVTGTGPSITWTAPSTTGTPRLTLVVSDGVGSATRTADVSVHDSINEIGDLAQRFLLEFSDSSIRDPAYVVRNFSTSPRCVVERDSEYADVVKNREHYQIESYFVGNANVTVKFATLPCAFRPKPGDACAVVPLRWNWLCLKTFDECIAGQRGVSEGNDEVAAVYEGSQWKLCSSDFDPKDGIVRPNLIR